MAAVIVSSGRKLSSVHKGGEAERPDVGTGLSVGHVSLPWLICPVSGTAPSTRPLKREASPTVSQVGMCQEAGASVSQRCRAG
jgi:hypothetical protein